jgi:CBS domain-containing protein
MIAHHKELRHTIVYDRSGEAIVERVQVPNPPDIPIENAPLQAEEPRVQHVMSNDLVCASEDLEIAALVSLVVRNRIGCIPVVDRLGRAVGVVTKTDLVEHLDILLHGPATGTRSVTRARDVMMPLPMTIPDSATLARAANLMVLEDIHHVLVVSDQGFLVGVVSTKDLVHWLIATDRLANVR